VLAGFSALDFGLAGTAWAELELLGDEIHMRNGSLYVYGAMKCNANQLLMDNSTIQIIGGSSILTKTTIVEVNHLELKVSDTPYGAHCVLINLVTNLLIGCTPAHRRSFFNAHFLHSFSFW
jgi:hypothetical protein